MAGLKIEIPTTFTDQTLPILDVDPILTSGSLVLVDPTHPAAPWPDGVPENGSKLINLASRRATALTGDSAEDWKPKWEMVNAPRTWRSERGGLQFERTTGSVAVARAPIPLMQHIKDNLGHTLYVSLWLHSYGEAVNGVLTFAGLNTTAADPTGSGAWVMTGTHGGRSNTQSGPFHLLQSRSYIGVSDGTAEFGASYSRLFGGENGGPNPPGGQHTVLRFYVEDLTVSGRASLDVEAIDRELYTKEVLTEGGRYYGHSTVKRTA